MSTPAVITDLKSTDDQTTSRLPYFLKEEVAAHNVSDDCWVSKFGKVLDLTPLVNGNKDVLAAPIIKFAGQDISHWFNDKTGEVKTFVHPTLHITLPYTPHGRFLHVAPPEPVNNWDTDFGTPWWDDAKYVKGLLSKRKRNIRVVNNLTGHDHVLDVCAEDTLEDIQGRYLRYNQHAAGYTWKHKGRPLNMQKTLHENDIEDAVEQFAAVDVHDDPYIPAVHLDYNDELTIA